MNKKPLVFSALSALAGVTLAHDGHGLAGSHAHATDSWGFVVLAVLVAAAWWAGRGR